MLKQTSLESYWLYSRWVGQVVPIDNKERELYLVTSIRNGVVSGYDCRTAYHFDFDENKEEDKFEDHYREATNCDILLYSFPELRLYRSGKGKSKEVFTLSENWLNAKYEDKN